MSLPEATGTARSAKSGALGVFEFLVVSFLALLLLSQILAYLIPAASSNPGWLDRWYMCYVLENQVTRILGLNPGGLWDGGIYYPFQAVSILFDEPSWGVSLLVAPIWPMTKNIFAIFLLGGIPALYFSWICTYYFVKSLGGEKMWAFCAAGTFCLSGISLILIMQQFCFWSFFLIPLLGILTVKIFTTPRIRWGVLWGALFGLLAWSSAHLFVMGGLFLGALILRSLLVSGPLKKAVLVWFVALLISGMIAGAALGPMYLVHEKFTFFRDYRGAYLYASNWANLFYRSWPPALSNPFALTPLWDYLKANAKGETTIGVSLVLFCSALGFCFARMWESFATERTNRFSSLYLAATIAGASLLAFLNTHVLLTKFAVKYSHLLMPSPTVAKEITYGGYAVAGAILYAFGRRILSALKRLDVFLFLLALFFGFLTFGPYYDLGSNRVIPSPIAFLIYAIPGISGIQATARWGLLLSFSLSVSAAIFLSQWRMSRRIKIFPAMLMFIAFLELAPGRGVGYPISQLKDVSFYQWTPRETDVFLKGLPGSGAVLELSSYPIEREQQVTSPNSLGYALFSRLYHKKPLVTGYSSYAPHVIYRYLFGPADKTLSGKTISILRKFGARYWVFHIESWSPEAVRSLTAATGELKKIAELDQGKTLVYEDPEPKVSVGYLDVK